jgi:hypothetical protein
MGFCLDQKNSLWRRVDGVPFDDLLRQFVFREMCFEGIDDGVSASFDLKVGPCALPGHGGSTTQREDERVALPSVFGNDGLIEHVSSKPAGPVCRPPYPSPWRYQIFG